MIQFFLLAVRFQNLDRKSPKLKFWAFNYILNFIQELDMYYFCSLRPNNNEPNAEINNHAAAGTGIADTPSSKS